MLIVNFVNPVNNNEISIFHLPTEYAGATFIPIFDNYIPNIDVHGDLGAQGGGQCLYQTASSVGKMSPLLDKCMYCFILQ